MEYVQMTLDDWLSIKEQLKKDLNGVAESFVRIGYNLRRIEEGQLYRNDGYDTISAFAKAEYGLSPSTTSRFMDINRRYSVNGYSELLRPEFSGMGSTKLAEMLGLPDGDMEMIRPETTREDIRELKRFNRQQPDPGTMGIGLKEAIRKFYTAYPDLKKDLKESREFANGDLKGMTDILNPGGNRVFRSGTYFIMMYEDKLKVKEFGKENFDLSWEEFIEISRNIFRDEEEAAGENAPEEETRSEAAPEVGNDPEMDAGLEVETKGEPERQAEKNDEPEEEIAPAQMEVKMDPETEGQEETLMEAPDTPEAVIEIDCSEREEVMAAVDVSDMMAAVCEEEPNEWDAERRETEQQEERPVQVQEDITELLPAVEDAQEEAAEEAQNSDELSDIVDSPARVLRDLAMDGAKELLNLIENRRYLEAVDECRSMQKMLEELALMEAEEENDENK